MRGYGTRTTVSVASLYNPTVMSPDGKGPKGLGTAASRRHHGELMRKTIVQGGIKLIWDLPNRVEPVGARGCQ